MGERVPIFPKNECYHYPANSQKRHIHCRLQGAQPVGGVWGGAPKNFAYTVTQKRRVSDKSPIAAAAWPYAGQSPCIGHDKTSHAIIRAEFWATVWILRDLWYYKMLHIHCHDASYRTEMPCFINAFYRHFSIRQNPHGLERSL